VLSVKNSHGSPRPGYGPLPTARSDRARPLSRSRAAVLDAVAAESEPCTLLDVATTTGLHENTAREHLEALREQGFVVRSAARPHGRGRPAWRYAVAAGPSPDAVAEYAGLATALVEHIHHTSADPHRDAVAAGVAWGRRLSREHPLPVRHNAASARRQVLDVLEDLGFAPQDDQRSTEAVLTRCPLLDTATRYPDVVCGVHLGIVRGAIAGYDLPPDGVDLHPFSEPHGCQLHLGTVEQEDPR
jgi:predicted ArsR family transcriptional regulator